MNTYRSSKNPERQVLTWVGEDGELVVHHVDFAKGRIQTFKNDEAREADKASE